MGVFLTVLQLLPSVIQGLLQVIREAKKNGNTVVRSKVAEGVCRGVDACAVKSKV